MLWARYVPSSLGGSFCSSNDLEQDQASTSPVTMEIFLDARVFLTVLL